MDNYTVDDGTLKSLCNVYLAVEDDDFRLNLAQAIFRFLMITDTTDEEGVLLMKQFGLDFSSLIGASPVV